MEPNKERIRLWSDALRSDEFEQGAGRLCVIVKDKPRYCCLGVACEVAIRNGLTLEKGSSISSCDCELCRSSDATNVTYNGQGSVLPERVREWYGLTSSPNLKDSLDEGRYHSAIEMNDQFKRTFAQIADAIEATYLREETDK